MKKILLIVLLFWSGVILAQPSWTVVTYTNSTTAYGIVTINGNPAEAGDYVGAFVGNECRANQQVIINSGIAYANLQIQGESAETVSFKVWDASASKELTVSMTTQSAPGSTIGSPPNYLQIRATAPTITVAPENQDVGYLSGTINFAITSNSNWTASSNATWCTVPTSGSGSGTLTATFTENPSSTVSRTATITITVDGVAPVEIRVTQAKNACALGVSPSNQNVTSMSGTIPFALTTECAWTASSNATWCTVPASGSGSGTLTATFSENPSSTVSRTATIAITVDGVAPVEVTVNQAKKACALGVTPSNQDVTSMSGTIPFVLTSECAWTASSNAAWCTVPASGSGSGTLTATFTENPSSTVSRTATITITVDGVAPVEVTVSQAKKACALGVTPSNQNVTSMSGTIPFVLTSECAWTASSDAAWCTVPASGSGSGTLTATFEANTTSSSRVARITVTVEGIDPITVTVVQETCTLAVNPLSHTFKYQGERLSSAITANAYWTVATSDAWISISSTSGVGVDTLDITVQPNTGEVRSGSVTVSGCSSTKTITVKQEARVCSLAVSFSALKYTESSGSKTIEVSSNTDWVVNNNADWITVSKSSGSNNGSFSITVDENTGEARSGSVTVSGCSSTKSITVNQEAWVCSLAVSPSALTYTGSSGTKTLEVSSNTDWTVANNADWITVSKSSSSNNGSFTITVDENTGEARSGSVTVSGCSSTKTITVNQEAWVCSLAVSPSALTYAESSGTKKVEVSSNTDWTVTNNADWITVSKSNGSNNGSFTITAKENTGKARSGSVTVSGCSSTKTITVNQEAWVCSLTVSPSELTYTESSGTKRVAVSSNTDWVVSNDADWITVSKSNGSNNGSFTITAKENTGKARSGSVTVSGCSTKKSIHINQYSGFKLNDFQVNLQDTIMENDTLDVECIATYSDGSIDSVLSGIVWGIGCDLPIEIDTVSGKVIAGEVAGTDSCSLIATYQNFSDTVFFVLKDITVGIEQGYKNDFSINLYPNPSKGQVNLDIDRVLASRIELVVYNLSGDKVFYQTICTSDEISIDLSHEVSGIYFVKIIDDDREIVKKLILKKN